MLSTGQNPLIELSFMWFSISHTSRPGSHSSTTDVSLDKIFVLDHFTPHTAFGLLLNPSSNDMQAPQGRNPFFKLTLDFNPIISKDTSASIFLELMPSDVVINKSLIDRVGTLPFPLNMCSKTFSAHVFIAIEKNESSCKSAERSWKSSEGSIPRNC